MKKSILAYFLIVSCCCAEAVCVSCGSGASSMTMDWNISGATDGKNDSVYCVGQAVSMGFWGFFNRRPLDDVKLCAFLNGSRVAANVSGYDGTSSLTLNNEGSYMLLAERHGYSDIVAYIEVGSCAQETTTITVTTASSTLTTTSTSTTSSSSSTASASPNASSAQQPNEGDGGIDLALPAVMALALAATGSLAYLSRRKKRF